MRKMSIIEESTNREIAIGTLDSQKGIHQKITQHYKLIQKKKVREQQISQEYNL